VSAGSLRPATAADVPRLTELVHAAYGHYVERLGEPPRPMTDDYAEIVRTYRVTVAERSGQIVGLIVLGVDDEGFFVDNVAVDPGHQGLLHASTCARATATAGESCWIGISFSPLGRARLSSV
jgi:hypothetical protein